MAFHTLTVVRQHNHLKSIETQVATTEMSGPNWYWQESMQGREPGQPLPPYHGPFAKEEEAVADAEKQLGGTHDTDCGCGL
jgi:hypothetical protein